MSMNKKQVELVVVALTFAALAYLFQTISGIYFSHDNICAKIETNINKQYQEINELFSNKSLFENFSRESVSSLKEDQTKFQERLINKNFEIYVISDQEITFWSDASILVDHVDAAYLTDTSSWCVQLPGKSYAKVQDSLILPDSSWLQLVALIRVDNGRSVQSPTLNDSSEPYTEADIYQVKLPEDRISCSLVIKKDIRPKWNQSIPLFCLFVSAFFVCLFLHNTAKRIVKSKGAVWAALFLTLSVFSFRIVSLTLNWNQSINEILGIQEVLNSSLFTGTVVDILINAILVFWLILFYNKEVRIKKLENLSIRYSILLTILNYFAIILGLIFLSTVTKSIVVSSGIKYDFENVFNLNQYSFLSLLGILILLISLFLFSNRMMETVNRLGLSKNARLASVLFSCLLSLPILHLSNLDIYPFFFYLATLIYIVLFDVFIDHGRASTNWIIVWLIIMAGLSSLLLFNYNADIDIQNRIQFAQKLSSFYELDQFNERSLASPAKNQDKKVIDEAYNDLSQQFDYAIYKEGNRIVFNGSYYLAELQVPDEMEDLTYQVNIENDRSNFLYKVNSTTYIIIGKKMNGLIKPLSLFSYVFALLLLIVTVLAIINKKWTFLPQKFNFYIHAKPSLSNKIQFAVISLIISSFLIIALVTFMYFRNTSKETQLRQLNRKSFALHADISNMIKKDSIYNWNKTLFDEVNSIANIHQTNFQVYDTTGNLLTTAHWNQVPQNTYPHKMGIAAFMALQQSDHRYAILEEGLFEQKSTSSYMSIASVDGHDLAYISVPMYNKDGNNRTEVNNFMGTLLNVYVFLFLIAGAIAIAVANSITHPLSVLGEKLKNIRLGKRNEPLAWENQDELGDLIKDYNAMIKEIDESTELLATTQRDIAWREMAKQIAHEIKNPLTPMKLSIQHLQYAIQSDRSDFKSLVERVSATLIEQIDNLAGIASEFTNFAKLPQAENEKTILNEIVSSVHDLFRKRDDMDINLYVPIDEIYVFADKNHLIRILNNLLNNAIQSIPTDRRGKIDIELYKEDKYAIIKVTDNGTGIPDNMRDKVFSPNFTTKSSGTGLGLAIASNMAETFNAKIYFESMEVGTAFYLQIPLMHMDDNFENPKRVILR